MTPHKIMETGNGWLEVEQIVNPILEFLILGVSLKNQTQMQNI